MRRKIFFYSDPHFNHANIIRYCNRPFKNVDQMNEALIKNYNFLVRDDDLVYFMGDLGLDKGLSVIIKQLKGKKILIKGNHDKLSNQAYYNMGFTAVLQYAKIKVGKNYFTLSHYPNRSLKSMIHICYLYFIKTLRTQKKIKYAWNRFKKEWNRYKESNDRSSHYRIHGHVHGRWKTMNRNINTSVDVWDFKPVSVNKIVEVINKGQYYEERK